MPSGIYHVIADRDGVLNQEAPGGYVLNASQWRWMPGSLEALALLSGAGICVSVATNQSGVGRGLMGARDLAAVHERMCREAEAVGATIAGIHACTHTPRDGCGCRKPAGGLLERAIDASGIARSDTLMVGDSVTDMEAASSAGIRAALVLTGKGRASAAGPGVAHVSRHADFAAFAIDVIERNTAREARPNDRHTSL